MSDAIVGERIGQAAALGSSTLDLSGLGLRELPHAIEALTNVEVLDLSGNGLDEVPARIFALTNLQQLDLKQNRITRLPADIARLFRLRQLDLRDNPLDDFPKALTKLERLHRLNLNSCTLKELPAWVGEFQALDELELWNNKFAALPTSIDGLQSLTKLDIGSNPFTDAALEFRKLQSLRHLRQLTIDRLELVELPTSLLDIPNLKRLNAYHNEIRGLPPSFRRLASLESLDLSVNQITDIPKSIAELAGITRLTLFMNLIEQITSAIGTLGKLDFVDLDHNRLQDLPREIGSLRVSTLNLKGNRFDRFPEALLDLTTLQVLDLGENAIADLPADIGCLSELRSLSLHANRLSQVPDALTKLGFLAYLDLTGNPLPVPLETLEDQRDVKRVLTAVAAIGSGKRLNEAKLLVVGDGKVGKSSVVARLIHDTFDPGRETTLGVDINDEIRVTESRLADDADAIRLNIWDFGGQEIQHSTHQFFLTTRSLYLLVVDARKGDQISNIEYWLKLIKSFGGDSPIIVVVNQMDQLKGQRELNIDRNALKAKYNIRFFAPTACTDGAGFPELRRAISEEVERLDHVRAIWPKEWFEVRQRLKALPEDYIPFETYLRICTEQDVAPDLRESLLGLLHDLGVVIRFPGETQVLNPRWVTHGVYGLLTAARLVKAQGQFDLRDMADILAALPDGDRYPPHTHQRLINVMQHFELCFEFTDPPGRYLIPRHLHDNELDIHWDDDDALHFQYHYDTLPDAIVSRFIVRMSRYIDKQYYWKNGVFLQGSESFRKNRAKVKADLVDKLILISVIGNPSTRRLFLAIIRSTLDDLNGNYKIRVGQFMPLPAHPTVLVSYEALLAHEQMGVDTMVVPEVLAQVRVKLLLDGIDSPGEREAAREPGGKPSMPPPVVAATPPHPEPRPAQANPWRSGSFYLVAFVVVVAVLIGVVVAVTQADVSSQALLALPAIVIGAVLVVGVIGAIQLRNDDLLSEKSFLQLMLESYKRLPLLQAKPGKAVGKRTE